MHRRRFLAGALVTPALGRTPPSSAQAWPNRPLRFVVPRAPGGSIDIAGRLIADAIGAELGQAVVVEAKPGANGMIGSGLVARAPPDGYAWLLATVNHLVAPILQPAPYHPVADFRAAARFGSFASIAVVRAALPAATMHEFIAYARSRPGALNYLNSGNGSTMHLATELLKLRQGIDLVSIQYKGMQVGIGDLLAGRLDFGFTVPALVLQHIQAGRLRALAVAGAQRLAALPEVPTLAELDLQDIQLESWFALLGPAGVPDDIIARLHDAARRVLQQQALQRQLAINSLDMLPAVGPAELQRLLQSDFDRFARLVTDAKIKAEP